MPEPDLRSPDHGGFASRPRLPCAPRSMHSAFRPSAMQCRLTSSNLHKMDYAEGKGVTARCGRGVVHGSPSQQLPTRELRIGDVHRPVGDSLHLDERLSFFLPLRRTLASISGGIFRESAVVWRISAALKRGREREVGGEGRGKRSERVEHTESKVERS